jgi:hypothetical protein
MPTKDDTFKTELKFSEDLKIGDEFYLAGILVRVEKRRLNKKKHIVLELFIYGASFKKYSTAMLIFPPRTPMDVVEEGEIHD